MKRLVLLLVVALHCVKLVLGDPTEKTLSKTESEVACGIVDSYYGIIFSQIGSKRYTKDTCRKEFFDKTLEDRGLSGKKNVHLFMKE